jgi:transposase
MSARKRCPSDVSDAEWAFVSWYLTLMTEDAPQRAYAMRDVFDALRWLARTGSPWRCVPGGFPPWEAAYQQTPRWIRAGRFEAIVHDLRATLRRTEGRSEEPSAVILGGRTLRSTVESGDRLVTMDTRRRRAPRSASPSPRWAICWRWR